MEFVITGRMVQGDLTRKGDSYGGKPIPPEKQGYFLGVAVEKSAGAPVLNDLIAFAWGEYAANPNVQQAINDHVKAHAQRILENSGTAQQLQQQPPPGLPDPNQVAGQQGTPSVPQGAPNGSSPSGGVPSAPMQAQSPEGGY